MIEDGLAWFNEQMEGNASVEMVFHRDDSSVPVSAIPRRQFSPPASGSGPPPDPNKEERMLSVVYDDLASVLEGTMPAIGDYFVEEINGSDVTFKVANSAIGLPCSRWESGYRGPGARILVQTKRVSDGD